MEGEPLLTHYDYLFPELKRLARAENKITEHNVYQEANLKIREIVDGMLTENLLPGSRLDGIENFEKFAQLVNQGKRGLILMEHYSNFDLPEFIYMLRKFGSGVCAELAERTVAIAGMKLNEENPMVSAWAEAYNRIIIYPSRSLAAIEDPAKREEEEARSRKINFASMRALSAAWKKGQVILVFPAGTRYRPNCPETKRGVREIDSYLRLSDVMILVSNNGNCLRISDDHPENMMMDRVCKDTCILAGSEPIDCKKFRTDIIEAHDVSDEDHKQIVVDRVMELLEEQHIVYEKKRTEAAAE